MFHVSKILVKALFKETTHSHFCLICLSKMSYSLVSCFDCYLYLHYFEDIKYNYFKPTYQLFSCFHFLQGVLFQLLNLLVCSCRLFSLIHSGIGVSRLVLSRICYIFFLSLCTHLSLVRPLRLPLSQLDVHN